MKVDKKKREETDWPINFLRIALASCLMMTTTMNNNNPSPLAEIAAADGCFLLLLWAVTVAAAVENGVQ